MWGRGGLVLPTGMCASVPFLLSLPALPPAHHVPVPVPIVLSSSPLPSSVFAVLVFIPAVISWSSCCCCCLFPCPCIVVVIPSPPCALPSVPPLALLLSPSSLPIILVMPPPLLPPSLSLGYPSHCSTHCPPCKQLLTRLGVGAVWQVPLSAPCPPPCHLVAVLSSCCPPIVILSLSSSSSSHCCPPNCHLMSSLCCHSLIILLIVAAAGCCHCHFICDPPHEQLLMGLEVGGVSGVVTGGFWELFTLSHVFLEEWWPSQCPLKWLILVPPSSGEFLVEFL